MKLSEVAKPRMPSTAISTRDEAINWIALHAKDISAEIFRGDYARDTPEMAVYDTEQISRVSRNTANFYTQWMDNHPQWAAYPKRSKSMICSSSDSTARGYGHIKLIIPSDNCLIGVCPTLDLWQSFSALFRFVKLIFGQFDQSMDTMNRWLARMFSDLIGLETMDEDELQFKNIGWDELKRSLQEITPDLIRDTVREKSDLSWSKEKLRGYINLAKVMERGGHDSFFDVLAEKLDPKKNGFELHTPATLPRLDNRELWIGKGNVLAIRPEDSEDLRELVAIVNEV